MTLWLDAILDALAAQEQAYLTLFEIERAANLKAYATFPPPQDYDPKLGAKLAFPFTCHEPGRTIWEPVTVGVMNGAVEDEQTHTVEAGVIFGLQADPPHLLIRRDAQWRNAYREFILKNLNLKKTLQNSSANNVTVTMGDTNPVGFDFANMQLVGVLTTLTICVRQLLPTV